MWTELWTQAQNQSPAAWGAVIGAVLYLYLATRENPWCWFWGIISCLLWAWVAFYEYKLYQDAILQLFYVGISFWGLYQWRFGGENREELPVTRMTSRQHGLFIACGLVISVLCGWGFARWTDAAAPYIDGLTTVFSVLITFLVIFKKLENWIYWLVIDTIYVGLYWSREGYLFSILFVVYLVLAWIGYRRWRRVVGQ